MKADIDRSRASRLMAERGLDALLLAKPESFRWATAAPPGVAAFFRRAGAALALIPGDARRRSGRFAPNCLGRPRARPWANATFSRIPTGLKPPTSAPGVTLRSMPQRSPYARTGLPAARPASAGPPRMTHRPRSPRSHGFSPPEVCNGPGSDLTLISGLPPTLPGSSAHSRGRAGPMPGKPLR